MSWEQGYSIYSSMLFVYSCTLSRDFDGPVQSCAGKIKIQDILACGFLDDLLEVSGIKSSDDIAICTHRTIVTEVCTN